ncbi:[protein-PII] uridylyltransferase [Moraxella osloensis]|nr:[protein-PII] uridylyltransferase [Moraxella osloensis]MDI4481026.1 [protein-PII] uridylyltransferase [Moraxella osloensis]
MFTCPPILPYFTPLPALSLQGEANLGIPAWLAAVEADLDKALASGIPIRQVVMGRCCAIDSMMAALFELYELDQTDLTLFATGGYGRGELHPFSDVDLLLLSPNPIDESLNQKISPFVAKLWDIGIDPALVVRSVEECDEACHDDITVATSLLEARILAGNVAQAGLPMQLLNKNWSQTKFYEAKMAEAKERYLKHNSTEYNLEPDLKNAPGGLRDIHTVGWISKRYFRVTNLFGLVQQEFITEKEFDELQQAEDFLWLIRHHLHKIAKRNENRVLFDYQRLIAERIGYRDNSHPNAAVEQFMRDYYRYAMSNSTLSEMLTQHYYETLIEARLPDEQRPVRKVINERFKLVGDRIAVTHSRVFAQHPTAILEMFLLMGQQNIRHIRTRTLRILKIAARGIDEHFRNDPANKAMFMDNIKEQNLLFWRLRVMKRYGVLGSYLPAFGQITGLMQYDLFHRYTVDAHILMLIRMLHRFTDDNYVDTYPLVSGIYRRIDRKEMLVLAAIFHDIAKGRGGDHSELGEQDAIKFCLSHGLSQADAELVGWLVSQHLLMSMTAQKKDISDPEVVAEFADKVGNVTYLNYLYVLTVADMNATNPQLWNSWRATLMRQLYTQTRRILRADIDAPMNRQDMIASNKQSARDLLAADNSLADIESLWDGLGEEYFLREVPSDIVWHSKAIMAHDEIQKQRTESEQPEPLIILREHRELALDAVQVFIYTHDQSNLFAVTMTVFDQMDLDVLDARVITASRDFALDSYVLLDRHGTLLTDTERQTELIERLKQAFISPTLPEVAQRRMPRQLKHFHVPTKVSFSFNPQSNQHMMILETLDQPALLARVGQVFLAHDIEVHFARITTLGERAEDMFFITDHEDKPLSDERLEKLKQALVETLNIS